MYVSEYFIALAIPKCASRTMREWNELYGGSIDFGMHGMSSDAGDYEGKIVFSPVRNPYSRAISLWKHVKKLYRYSDSIDVLMEEFMGVKDMVLKDVFRYSQIGFLRSFNFPFDKVEVTYIHMENFEEELKALPFFFHPLSKEGASHSNSWEEVKSLSRGSLDLINEWASKDFDVLSYDRL